MDRVRGGVFSGAMVLAGISATLLSALLAIGIRQVTALHENRPNHLPLCWSLGRPTGWFLGVWGNWEPRWFWFRSSRFRSWFPRETLRTGALVVLLGPRRLAA